MSRGGEQWYINPQKTQPSQNLVQKLVTCFKFRMLPAYSRTNNLLDPVKKHIII